MGEKTPEVAYAFVADGHKEGESGKIDVQGIFAELAIWATPAKREFSLVVGIRNVPSGETDFSLWIRRRGSPATQVGKIEIEADRAPEVITIAERTPIIFHDTGVHELGVSKGQSVKGPGTYWIPIGINLLPWPKIPTGEALQKLLKKPDVVRSARALLTCEKCGSTYIFQKDLDPNAELGEGAVPFPEEGRFQCTECGSVHYTRDIEGQVTSQLGKTTQGRD